MAFDVSSSPSVTQVLADWTASLSLSDVPGDVLSASEARILDVLGLVMLARRFDIGQALLRGARTLGGPPEARIFGEPGLTGAATAALANGAMAEAIEFDDTHNETVVHVGAPVVAAALAAADAADAGGLDLLLAVAAGAEATCRLAAVGPGLFHPRGFHPTGIFGPFGAVFAAGRASGASSETLVHAAGIAGSQACGLLECWSDGTWAKAAHPGWAAHTGILALRWAAAGLTGPARVIEGRAGLYRAYVPDASPDFARATAGLGDIWEGRNISFKPYPAAHVLHGLLEAALSLSGRLDPDEIDSVVCDVAPHWEAIVCEPLEVKQRPASAAEARISLQHAVAEALVFGDLSADAFGAERLQDGRVRRLAAAARYQVRPDWTDRTVFPGRLHVRLRDGRDFSSEVMSNLGGAARPMPFETVAAKFRANVAGVLSPEAAERVCRDVRRLREGLSARQMLEALE